jgi:hypothetical protein
MSFPLADDMEGNLRAERDEACAARKSSEQLRMNDVELVMKGEQKQDETTLMSAD